MPKKKLELPNLVFFDLDNTLYDYSATNTKAEAKLFKHMSETLSLDVPSIKKSFQESRINVKNRLGSTASSHSRILYIAEMFRVLDIRVRPSLALEFENYFWSIFISSIKVDPSAQDFILLLRQLKIQTVLVTDLTVNIQYRKLIRLGLNDAFDLVLTSEEVGGDKVTGLPFETAFYLTREVENNLAWFIGDSDGDFPSKNPYKESRYFLMDNTNRLRSTTDRKIERFSQFSFFIEEILSVK